MYVLHEIGFTTLDSKIGPPSLPWANVSSSEKRHTAFLTIVHGAGARSGRGSRAGREARLATYCFGSGAAASITFLTPSIMFSYRRRFDRRRFCIKQLKTENLLHAGAAARTAVWTRFLNTFERTIRPDFTGFPNYDKMPCFH